MTQTVRSQRIHGFLMRTAWRVISLQSVSTLFFPLNVAHLVLNHKAHAEMENSFSRSLMIYWGTLPQVLEERRRS
jgi:hypothetical protein